MKSKAKCERSEIWSEGDNLERGGAVSGWEWLIVNDRCLGEFGVELFSKWCTESVNILVE